MMEPYYEHAGISLWQGDCRDVLATLPDGSVQTIVTSPPYLGLRDYGTAEWEGGDASCDHTMPSRVDALKAFATSTLVGSKDTQGHLKEPSYRDVCGKCGARRIDRQIGLESDPAAYVAEMVSIFREVRRVLRDDGTVWLNLGDSYATHVHTGDWGLSANAVPRSAPHSRIPTGFKPKDLLGIPWRVAFALQADGWWLRSDVIWNKPNPMPESVTDRPTRSHEYIFLLSKSARYYYDADAILEPVQLASLERNKYAPSSYAETTHNLKGRRAADGTGTRVEGRNKRDVWTVVTAPYPDAHFATFPPKLIEPCILAGCPAGGVVLDPFAGAGTTLLVAKKLNRRGVGIELNPAYCDLIVNRLRQDVLPLEAAGD